ncbi:hypothetical protein [Mycobacterium sp.]|uniref:hypothetical protein n=1 Tax=Mycobacterium sp. TaxID=1785 RepID=UPI002C4FD7A9|nr:hypothetical protein [Mycobacterium sp.]HTQ22506.1 hypothetical protein [Mycobacterium sp.]
MTRSALSALLAAVLSVVVLPLAPAGATAHEANGRDHKVNVKWAFGPAPTNHQGRPFFNFTQPAGGTLRDRVMISNFGNIPLTFDLYAADGYNQADGAFVLAERKQPRKDVGAWVSLPVKAVTVAPKMQSLIPFSLHVPGSATPGDHAGGIVALQRPISAPPGQGLNVVARHGIGARIYLRVPGPLHPQVAVTSVEVHKSSGPLGGGHGTVVATVVNTGNVRLNATVTAKATNIFGGTIKTFAAQKIPSLLPGNTIEVVFQWPSLPRIGPIHVKVNVDAAKAKAEGGTTFWVIPWLLVLIAVLLLVGLGYWWRHRRHNVGPATPASHPVVDPETPQPS